LAATGRFDTTWATSDPLATLGLAAELAGKFDLPWIADIRDSYNVQPFGSWYKRPIWAFHERRFCRQAKRVFTVSPGLAQGLTAATGRAVEVMENGFDPEFFPPAPRPPRRKFSLVYTGNLVLPNQNPRPLFAAIQRCLEQGIIPRDDFEFVFYGPSFEQLQPLLPCPPERLSLEVRPKVPHRDIVVVQQNSEVLLLFAHAHDKGVLTGKIFDYLGAGRPILAVPDDHGDVSDLLRRTGAGVSASTVEEITRVLTDWHAQWKTSGIALPRNLEQINRYSRRAQAKRLAQVLDTM
jgi:glycosyltransferase involved in cell wall biosynthesis